MAIEFTYIHGTYLYLHTENSAYSIQYIHIYLDRTGLLFVAYAVSSWLWFAWNLTDVLNMNGVQLSTVWRLICPLLVIGWLWLWLPASVDHDGYITEYSVHMYVLY